MECGSCRGSATWSNPTTVPADSSGDIVEPIQTGAVERRHVAAVLFGQCPQRLVDGALRLGERAVRVRVVRRPHTHLGTDEWNGVQRHLLLLEGGDDLMTEDLAGRDAR